MAEPNPLLPQVNGLVFFPSAWAVVRSNHDFRLLVPIRGFIIDQSRQKGCCRVEFKSCWIGIGKKLFSHTNKNVLKLIIKNLLLLIIYMIFFIYSPFFRQFCRGSRARILFEPKPNVYIRIFFLYLGLYLSTTKKNQRGWALGIYIRVPQRAGIRVDFFLSFTYQHFVIPFGNPSWWATQR